MLTPSSLSLSLLAHQSVALPADQQGANPGRSPDGQVITSQHGGRTQHSHTFCLGPKGCRWLVCVTLCSASALKGASQIFFLSDIALKCVCAHESVWQPRWAAPPPPPLPAPHSRQGSDQPCVVFSDGAWTWSLSRGNGLFSLPGLHKELHCSSPHIPRWLPTPGFGLPGRQGLRLHQFFLFFWPTARNIVYPSLLHLSAQSKYGTHQFWGFIPHKWLPVIPYSAHFLQGKKDSLLTLRLHPVYSLTRVRPGCWDRWWSSLTTPGESLLPLLLNNVNLNWIYEGTPTDT